MIRSSLSVLIVLLFSFISSLATAATVDGLEINYQVEGSGPTIIFVHGWTCDLSSWRDQIPVFAKNYQTISIDLPGHGKSDAPVRDAFSMHLFARAIEAVRAEVNATNSDELILVGHSMGVPVIKQYALLFPDYVAGLVAVDGPFDMRGFAERVGSFQEMTLDVRENMIQGMFVPSTPASLQTYIRSMMLSAPVDTANGAAAAMFDPGILSEDVIGKPALAVIAGTGSMPDMDTMKILMPDFEATRVNGTGHFLMMEKPEAFNALLSDFLTRVDF